MTTLRALQILAVLAPLLAVGAGSRSASAEQDKSQWWRSRGHGMLLLEQAPDFLIFEETAISRILSDIGRFDGGFMMIDGEPEAELIERSTSQLVILTGDGTFIYFDAIEPPPPVPFTRPTRNPVANFKVFWQTIEEQSSVITLAGADWKEAFRKFRCKIRKGTKEKRLFRIFGRMIATLNDGHTFVESSRRFAESGPDVEYIWMADRLGEVLDVIAQKADGGRLESALDGALYYGTLQGGRTGYLLIQRLDDFPSADNPYENATVFAASLDAILRRFEDTERMIVDLRVNEGGDDHVGMELVRRLIDAPIVGFYKQTRVGGYDELSERQFRHIEPDGVPYLGRPIAVLNTDANFSAGEVLALTLRELPQVILVGTPTYGILSNTLSRQLPNGWFLTISNERYSSNAGVDFEQRGIPPDVLTEAVPADLDAGRDPVLESALAELDKRLAPPGSSGRVGAKGPGLPTIPFRLPSSAHPSPLRRSWFSLPTQRLKAAAAIR